MAKLYFRYGAMNCGKTALLLQSVHNYEDRGMNVLVLKPRVDTKGGNKIVSRIGLEREVDHLVSSDEDLYFYLKREQVDQLLQIVVFYDIPIICYGLRTDFTATGFEGSTRLLEIAHTIEEMKTICSCGNKATFNARLINGRFTFSGDQVAIDGKANVTYESLCPKCYFKKMKKFNDLRNKLQD